MPQPRRPRKRPAGKPDEPHAIDITPEELGRLTPETLQRLKDEHGLELRIRSTVAGVDKLLGELGRKLDDDGGFDKVEGPPDGFDRGPEDPYSRAEFDRVIPEELGEKTNPEGS